MNNTETLKPCPVCGGIAHIDILSTIPNNYLRVVCPQCTRQTDGYLLGQRSEKDVRKTVIEAWNKRANENENE